MENCLQLRYRGRVRRAAACIALAFLALASPAQCVPARNGEAQVLPDTGLPVGGRLVTVYVSQENGPPRDESVRLPDSVLDDMASRSHECLGRQSIWDITDAFPWLRHGRILVSDCPLAVVYREASGGAVILNEKSGYGQIRRILDADIPDALQDKERFEFMLDALRYFTVPKGVLGTEAEFKRLEARDKELGVLREWLRGKVKDVSVFRRYCKDPVFSYDRQSGKWSLSFYVFNPEGGVNLVKAQGSDKPFRMEELTVEEVMPAGSFHYPLVG